MTSEEFVEAFTKRSADEGRLIWDGWLIFEALAIDPDTPGNVRAHMAIAFMLGAQHLFGSVMRILDPGIEPTENDLRYMDLIARELEEVYVFCKTHRSMPEGK